MSSPSQNQAKAGARGVELLARRSKGKSLTRWRRAAEKQLIGACSPGHESTSNGVRRNHLAVLRDVIIEMRIIGSKKSSKIPISESARTLKYSKGIARLADIN